MHLCPNPQPHPKHQWGTVECVGRPGSRDDFKYAVACAGSLFHWATSERELLERYTAWLNEKRAEPPDKRVVPETVRMSISDAHDLLMPGCDEPIERL